MMGQLRSPGRGRRGETGDNGRRKDARGKVGNRGVALAKKKVQTQVEITEGD